MKNQDPIQYYCTLINECINHIICEFSGPKPVIDHKELDVFTQAFIAVFIDNINEQEKEDDREFRAAHRIIDYKLNDIDTKSLRKIIDECKEFQKEHATAIENGGINFDDPYKQAGYDFYLTRCGHGAGFWESNDWPDPYGKELNTAAKKFGNVDGYVGDDNKIYIMGEEGDWTLGGMIQGVSKPDKPEEEKPYSDGYEGEERLGDDDDIHGLREGGSKLKKGETHAGITDDMSGRWTIRAFDTAHANKDETPSIKENLIHEPQPLLGIDEKNKMVYICAWCDKDKKITKDFHKRDYTTSHGICKYCRNKMMGENIKCEGIVKLKALLESNTEDEDSMWSDVGDVDKNFETGETNFPHGHGYPNSNKNYDKVVNLNSIYGVDDADVYKYNIAYANKVIQYVNQHLPWIKEYFKTDNYANHTDVWGATSAVGRTIDNFRQWANEKEENVTRPGAENWWLDMYKKSQRIIQEFPNVMQDIEKYHKFLEFIADESPENPENQRNYPLYVTLYDVTRALGGREEGGWWYDTPEMVNPLKVTNFAQAEKAAKVLYNEIKSADLDGQPHICIEKRSGSRRLREKPHYS